MQSQTIPKETHNRDFWGYDSGVWFAQLEHPAFTKICTRLKKDTANYNYNRNHNHFTLHYTPVTTLHYTALHFTALHSITLHDATTTTTTTIRYTSQIK